MSKIIFLGFPKCGTLSFHASLNEAGIKTAHYFSDQGDILGDLIVKAIAEGKKMLHYCDEFEAITQMDCYRSHEFICPQKHFIRLDSEYPGTKFILNVRKLSDHLNSIRKWGDLMTRMQMNFDPEVFFYAHYQQVRRYFNGRDNFIEYNLDKDTDSKLSSFIGREIKLVHINKSNA